MADDVTGDGELGIEDTFTVLGHFADLMATHAAFMGNVPLAATLAAISIAAKTADPILRAAIETSRTGSDPTGRDYDDVNPNTGPYGGGYSWGSGDPAVDAEQNNQGSGTGYDSQGNAGAGDGATGGYDASDGYGEGWTPIVLDLDNDGVELVDISESTAFFDISGDGYRTHMGWAGPNDGFLAYDIDPTGDIVEASELSFVSYVEGAQTDLEGLVYFDSNEDGVLDEDDDEWSKFGVWRDQDQDGVTDDGEFNSLDALNITSIDLTSDGISYDDQSNHVFGTGTYTRNGVTEDFGDVSLATSLIGFRETEDGSLDIQTAAGSDVYLDGLFSDLDVDLGELGYVGGFGFDGNDVISAGLVDETLLDGGEGDDTLFGGQGDDWILGGNGTDVIDGGEGEDILFIDADDLGVGGSVTGGNGFDIAFVDAPEVGAADVTVNLKANGLEALVSGDGDDTLTAGFVTADANDDQSIDTYLDGAAGNDVLTGGDGSDWLIGGEGADTISGGAGDDILFIDSADGAANINGGDGTDTVVVQDSTGITLSLDSLGLEHAFGGDGDDTFTYGGATDIILDGSFGNDVLTGGDGNDTLSGHVGDDTLTGGAGDDLYWFGYGFGTDTIVETASDQSSATDSVILNDTVERNDVTYTRIGDDLLLILEGDTGDTLTMTDWFADSTKRVDYFIYSGLADPSYAFVADDDANTFTAQTNDHYHFVGLAGDDTLTGAGGHDLLNGGAGNDILDGGTDGSDTVTYAGSDAAVSVDLAADTAAGGHAAGDTLDNIDNLYGSAYADTLTGDASANILTGADGNDILSGDDGDDTLIGGEGADSLTGGDGIDLASYLGSAAGVHVDLTAGTGADAVSGEESDAAGDTLTGIEDVTGSIYDDILIGDAAANTLRGEDGDDTLSSGVGDDTLVGGEGDDVATYDGNRGSFDVVYDRAEDAFTVTDLNASAFGDEGTDRVESVETLQFDGDGATYDLTATPVAWAAMAGLPTGGSAAWKLFASGGTLDTDGDVEFTFTVEAGAGGVGTDPIDIAEATTLGFDNSKGAVYETAHGHVQVHGSGTGQAEEIGTYTYIADSGYTGEDAFSFRVTDEATGMASVAEITVYAGTAMPEITEDDVISYDFYAGGTGDDTFMGGSGQDIISGGEGNDVLDGGSGQDVAQYAGARDDFDVVYNVAENTFTVTDTDTDAQTGHGDEGADTVSSVGQIDFLGDGGTIELADLVRAHDASLQVTAGSLSSGTLTFDGGTEDTNGDLSRSFSVENPGTVVDNTVATATLGFGTANNDVFETDEGYVQVHSDGTYTYKAQAGASGRDSFAFRVSDDNNHDLASVATINIGIDEHAAPTHLVNDALVADGSSQSLSWTPAAGDTASWTFSAWVKRATTGQMVLLDAAGGGAGEAATIRFNASDQLELVDGAGTAMVTTTAAYTATDTWMHVVAAYDSGHVEAADRFRFSVDGEAVTDYGTTDYPDQYAASRINAAVEHALAYDKAGSADALDGALAEVMFIDGAAAEATAFGADDGIGGWRPIAATGWDNHAKIAGATGTAIGNMTSKGGLAAAFNDDTDMGWNDGVAYINGTGVIGYVGKDWGETETKTITRFVVHDINNQSMAATGGASSGYTVKLQGFNETDASDAVDLYETTITSSSGHTAHAFAAGIDTSTAYRHHRVVLDGTGASAYGNEVQVAEIEFFEADPDGYGANGRTFDFADGNDLGADGLGAASAATANGFGSSDKSSVTPTSEASYLGTDANDVFVGGAGDDIYSDGAGDDTVTGGTGDDTMSGGAGNDTYVLSGVEANYTVSFDLDAGTFTVTDDVGNDGTDVISGFEVLDFAASTASWDLVNPIAAQDGGGQVETSGTLTGSFDTTGGVGTLTYALESGGGPSHGTVTVNADGTYDYDPTASSAVTDSFTYRVTDSQGIFSTASITIEVAGTANATEGSDSFQGDANADVLGGLGGDDHLDGAGGDDTLTGGMGDDTLTGGTGNDTLAGGAGVDTAVVAGNSGDYDIFYDAEDGTYLLVDNVATLHGDTGTDVLMAVEQVTFEGDNVTTPLENPAEAAPGTLHVAAGGVATWRLHADDADDSLTYAVEHGGATPLDGTTTPVIDSGFNTANGSVYATSKGQIQVKSDGTYEYRADSGASGSDSFEFRVSNTDQVSTLATISIEIGGTAAPTDNHDHLVGETTADTLDGGLGDDKITGGDGDDILAGGAGVDTAHYRGDAEDYTITYNAADGTFTVLDDKSTVHGNDGTDTLTGFEELSFAEGTTPTVDLTTPVAASDSAVVIQKAGSATWNLSVEDGIGTLAYEVNTANSALTTFDSYFDGNDGDVFATTHGQVQVLADGTYKYKADADPNAEGTDSFDYTVKDETTGIISEATVNISVGVPDRAIGAALTFDGSDDNLSWTPASAGDRKTWTYSFWAKADISGSTEQTVLSAGTSSSTHLNIYFADDKLGIYEKTNGTVGIDIETAALNNTSSEWSHYVVSVDTNESTASDRVKIYRNGSALTLTETTSPAHTAATHINGTDSHRIGTRYDGSGAPFDGDLTEIILVDGQALDADSFGATDTNSNWMPIQISASDLSSSVMGSNVTTDMTGATTSGATASASSESSGDYAWEAFDRAVYKWGATSSSNEWLQYEFASAETIEHYAITCDGTGTAPKDFKLEAHDGSNWVTLDTQTGETGWTQGDERTYSFTNTTAYTKYRLYIDNSNGSNVQLAEVKLLDTIVTSGFGDQGRYYDFSDSEDLGSDLSGNNNDATANNFAEDAQITDTPTTGHVVNVQETDADDVLVGDDGDNILNGAAGDDLLEGGLGDDLLTGGSGNDTADYSGDSDGYAVTYDTDAETFTVTDIDTSDGDDGTDTLTDMENIRFADQTVTAEDAQTWTSAVSSVAWMPEDGEVDWKVTGGSGSGTLTYAVYTTSTALTTYDSYFQAADGDVFATDHGQVQIKSDGSYKYKADENHTGTDSFQFSVKDSRDFHGIATVDIMVGATSIQSTIGHDSLQGGLEADLIGGDDGNDRLLGMEGDDQLLGGAGDDTLYGGAGDDVLEGGTGNDQLTGGDGNDIAVFDGDMADYRFTYDATTEIFKVVDADTTALDEGEDFLAGVETFRFDDGDITVAELQAAPVADGSVVQVAKNGVAEWNTNVEGGNGTLTYAIEGGTVVDNTTASNAGFASPNDDIYDVGDGYVRMTSSSGAYEYRPKTDKEGAESFDFRVTDAKGLSSVATITVGVGTLGYSVENSATFDGTDDYLDWTPTSAGDGTTWTYSFWAKADVTGSGRQTVLSVGADANNRFEIAFVDDKLEIDQVNGGTTKIDISSATLNSSTTGWNHYVIAVDTTEATSSDRVKLTMDGSVVTLTTTTAPDQDLDTTVNGTGEHRIGTDHSETSNLFDGQLAEVTLIDGQALDATEFGEDDGGTWRPVEILAANLPSGTGSTNATTAMSGYTTSGATASASSESSGDNAWKGFNHASTKWGATSSSNEWLQHEFASAITIGKYAIEVDGTNSAPKDFTFEGWDSTNSQWDTLDTQTGETGWTQGDVRTYTFTNTTAYTKYRLDVSASNSGNLQISELEMFEAQSAFGTNGRHLDFKSSSALGTDTSSTSAAATVNGLTQSTDTPTTALGATPTASGDFVGGTANADTLDALAGDDKIDGGAGNDTLTGGDGNDVLIGGAGDDVYMFGRGDDADAIDNTGESSSSDKVLFGADIDTDQLWFRMSGKDLVVEIIGTNDSITIDEWDTGTDNRVAEFETDDGSTLVAADVANLVSAMAALTQPGYGETELSSSSISQTDQTSLLATIAANWDSGA